MVSSVRRHANGNLWLYTQTYNLFTDRKGLHKVEWERTTELQRKLNVEQSLLKEKNYAFYS